MKINRCPKCGRKPSFNKLFNIKFEPIGYEVECYDCELSTGRLDTLDEAEAKWNELTKGENK